ncbi:MAG TPA: GSCFA domain-containing protein [Caulobacteraceae bacterium]
MPLLEIAAKAAMARLRSDPRTARWPGEGVSAGRFDGAAEVAFRPSFEIDPSDLIFTAGSCFARNIEFRLEEVGFRTPAYSHEVVCALEALGESPPFLNKYNVAVMRQELAWAAGEETGSKARALIPLPDGNVLDGLLNPRDKGGSLIEQARALRSYVEGLFCRFVECRVVVMTLGVAEVWRDRRSGLPLNKAPPANLIEADPDRFVLEVMAHQDVLAELEAIHGLLSRHGRPDVRMLITVSPVPLNATFRPVDVFTANAYSKAVQRAAAEAFALAHDNVDYFPSYEMVTLSDRRLAFDKDNRHVQRAMVDRIVDRFLRAYAPGLDFETSRRPLIRSSSPADLFDGLLQAADERMLARRFAEAAELYGQAIERFGDSSDVIGETELRLRHGTCLAKSGRLAPALAQLRLALAAGDDNRPAILLKCADRLIQCGDPAAAAQAIARAAANGAQQPDLAVRRAKLAAIA